MTTSMKARGADLGEVERPADTEDTIKLSLTPVLGRLAAD